MIDEDTVDNTVIFRFESADAARDAVGDLKDSLERDEDVRNGHVTRDGEFVIATGEGPIDDMM